MLFIAKITQIILISINQIIILRIYLNKSNKLGYLRGYKLHIVSAIYLQTNFVRVWY